ncbi:Uncharacterized protein TPAR_08632 [Tolypocladium paradoxum]|uniref:Uncharacterized protein n=1 Tax=Tolypocladium paradoxum TaxID=94208 RepID=A0A2S4KLV8_9HYPO|nr:Uncharacterized protein TPAR_08632 [Tolypocladium paradoxum]
MSAAPVDSNQLLPTQENLSELLEQLLAIFEVESIQKGQSLPTHPLQRELKNAASARHPLGPMSGNDFHIQPSFSAAPSWEALLQLEQNSCKICLPLCHIEQHSQSVQKATHDAEKAATLLCASWPDATVGPSRRRQLGPDFYHPDSPSYQLFQWLASEELSPTYEGVFLNDLFLLEGRFYQLLRQKPSDIDFTLRRSFTGPEHWVISLPVLSTILLLMTNPTKRVAANSDCPNRELSWCLDSMHGFCRQKGLEEGDRCLSWSLGTFPDCWMYLHFIFHYFSPYNEQENVDESDKWKGSGPSVCARRSITLPIGWDDGMETFREQRVWFGMRTATRYQGGETDMKHPAIVGFIMTDPFHHRVNATMNDWRQRGLESPNGASGVALFQMLLWSGLDEWSLSWNVCLDYIDKLHEVKAANADKQEQVEDLDNKSPKLSTLMFDPSGRLAKEYFVTSHLLKIFRKHVDVLPRSLRGLRTEWERTYPAMNSDLLERFDERTQGKLLKNWNTLITHADELHSELIGRIEKKTGELMSLRDSKGALPRTISIGTRGHTKAHKKAAKEITWFSAEKRRQNERNRPVCGSVCSSTMTPPGVIPLSTASAPTSTYPRCIGYKGVDATCTMNT